MSNPVKPQAPMTKNGQPFYPLTTIDQVLDSSGHRLSADSTIQVYTHTKTNNVHNFVGTGANGRAKITADFASGDTFQVNGTAVTAYWGADAPDADLIANGRWVSFIVDGNTINFKPGGGLSSSKLALATATESDVLSGETFYANSKNMRTGNIVSKAAETKSITPSTSSQSYTFATSGKYCTGNMVISVPSIGDIPISIKLDLQRWATNVHDNIWNNYAKGTLTVTINGTTVGTPSAQSLKYNNGKDSWSWTYTA